MKKLLLILFIPFIVNAQQISVMDAVVLKEGSDAEYMEIEEFWSKIHADIISQGKRCSGQYGKLFLEIHLVKNQLTI
ncbi:MAG: hypothetical protein ACJZZG_02660 [Cytophagales bacterium]